MATINSELLNTLAIAQLRWAHEMTDEEGIEMGMHSDDCYDYLRGALNLASALLTMQYDDDVAALRILLDPSNREEFVVHNYASDGICAAVWEALPEGWEDIAYAD